MTYQIYNILSNKQQVLQYAEVASKYTNDYKNFDERINNYIAFHVIKKGHDLVALSGIYKSPRWPKNIVRICDRTFYFSVGRSLTKSDALTGPNAKRLGTGTIIPHHIEYAMSHNYIPFYSILNRPRAQRLMINEWNKHQSEKMYQLNNLYWTCESAIKQDGVRCWQNIALPIRFQNNFGLISQQKLSKYILFTNEHIDKNSIKSEINDMEFLPFKSSVPVSNEFFNYNHDWKFTGLRWLSYYDKYKSVSKVSKRVREIFKDKPIKLSFFKQKSGVELPTHTDRGHEVSFNIVLSEKRSPITFNEVGDVEYEQALINVSKKHSVKKHSDERLLMKYLVYDIQFDEAVKRWKTTT
tara:strand:+ start:645 stop:1706 length:1062 start_codon:yes stop_codon:yes gene_type:complete